MPTREKVRDWADAYRKAWEGADSEAVAELFAEDSSYRELVYEDANLGRSGVMEYWTTVTSGQSEVTVRVGEPFVDGDRATVEFWTNMVVEGDPVTLAGCLLLTFDGDGLCSDLREYWNFTQGTHQPPEGWGT